MNDESNLSTAEISRRITVGMGLAYDLYNEMVGFFRMLRESLEASDLDVDSLMGKNFRLPLGHRKLRTPADNYMSVDLGLMCELGVASTDDDPEDEGEEEDSEEKANSNRRLITPDSQFLAIRAMLYDRRTAKDGDFTPLLVAVTLSGFRRTPRGKRAKDQPAADKFDVRDGWLKSLVKNLDASASNGQTVNAKVTKYNIEATISNIVVTPLAEFDSEDRVNAFVDDLVAFGDDASG